MDPSIIQASPPWLQCWFWSPAFQGAYTTIAIILLSTIVLLAIGCLIMGRGSGPATFSERTAARSKLRWIYTFSALLFPPMLALGTWMVVFPGAKPVRLYLISRVLNPADFIDSIWKKEVALSDEAVRSTLHIDVGPLVDEVLVRLDKHEKLSAIPAREELLTGSIASTVIREVLLDVLQHFGDLHVLQLKENSELKLLKPLANVTRWPAWFVESVELACLRLLAQRANVYEVFIADSGRVDRFGQLTYDDARGYLAGAGYLMTDSVHVVHASKLHNDVLLLSATRWLNNQALLLFQVPAVPIASTPSINVEVFVPADNKTGKQFNFDPKSYRQIVPQLIDLPADENVQWIKARTKDRGAVSQVELPTNPEQIEVIVSTDTWPTLSGVEDQSYYARALKDLKTTAKVYFSNAINSTRPILLISESTGIWLHHEGAVFNKATKPRGSNKTLRELQLGEVAMSSLLSLDRHQELFEEPAVPQASGFVLGWAPAYLEPVASSSAVTALQLGELMQEPSSIPLAVVLPDAKNPMESVIWLGIPPPKKEDRSISAAAYWWTVGNLSRRCKYPADNSKPIRALSYLSILRPINLLDDSLISQASVLAHADGAVALGFALFFASCASLAYIVSAKKGTT